MGLKKIEESLVLAVLVCSGAVPIQKVLPFGVDKVYCKTCLCLRQTCPGPHGKLQG